MSHSVKLVVSDFHLGEGKRRPDGSLNTLEDFTEDRRFVEFLDFYSKAHDRMELVINGNFFEMLRCYALPDAPDIMYETYAVDLLRTQMAGHVEVMDALKRFMEDEGHDLVFLIGEVDRGLHWPGVQQELSKVISPRIQFKSGFYLDRGVWIEHGHQYDPIHEVEGDVFDDVDGVKVLRLPWGAFFHTHFIQPLRTMKPQFYRVRPMRNYLVWALLFETMFFGRVIWQFMKTLWKAATKKLHPGASLPLVFKLFSKTPDSETLEDQAEALLLEEEIKKVIFGYSHLANYRQFSAHKEYFNTGSWTRRLSLDMRSLGAEHKLNYVVVEFVDDEPQAKLMEWYGRRAVLEDYY